MGFFKNAIVKGLSGAAGAATLAITKNPALAASASQLVNAHAHKLVDPAVKALANHKFSFGSGHKLSARDVLQKIRGVGGENEGFEEEPKAPIMDSQEENQEMEKAQDKGGEIEEYEPKGKREDYEDGEDGGFDVTAYKKKMKKKLKKELMRKARMGFHDSISHLGRKSKHGQYNIGYEK